MKKKTIIIDSGLGNINSLTNCIDSLEFKYEIVKSPDENIIFDKIIFPGVGSYSHAMESIISKKWDNFIKKNVIEEKKHYLGICIGMQILSNCGYENTKTKGLGIIDGEVENIRLDNAKFKVPHIGWNDVELKNKNELYDGIKNFSDFYFDHSFVFKTNDELDISTLTEYEKKFVSSVKKGNVFGTQFHPEKSADNGKKLLNNFLRL